MQQQTFSKLVHFFLHGYSQRGHSAIDVLLRSLLLGCCCGERGSANWKSLYAVFLIHIIYDENGKY